MEEIITFVQQNTVVTLIIGILLVTVLILVVALINQNQKYKEAIAPKFGFMGKPLYSFLMFAVLAGGISFAFFATQDGTIDDALADLRVSVEIDASVINPSTKSYQFRVTPSANGTVWGPYTYDAYWSFENADGTKTTAVENGLSIDSVGGVIKKLPSGVNKVKVNVFVEDKNVIDEIEVTVP
jgi:uncharacterized integral membrane protein